MFRFVRPDNNKWALGPISESHYHHKHVNYCRERCKFVLSFHVVASHWNKSIKNEDGAIPTPSHHRPSKWSPWRIIILACTVSGIRKRTHLIHYIYILFVFFLFCSIRFKKKKTKTRCSFLQCFPEFSKSLNYSLRYSSTLKLFLKFYLLF